MARGTESINPDDYRGNGYIDADRIADLYDGRIVAKLMKSKKVYDGNLVDAFDVADLLNQQTGSKKRDEAIREFKGVVASYPTAATASANPPPAAAAPAAPSPATPAPNVTVNVNPPQAQPAAASQPQNDPKKYIKEAMQKGFALFDSKYRATFDRGKRFQQGTVANFRQEFENDILSGYDDSQIPADQRKDVINSAITLAVRDRVVRRSQRDSKIEVLMESFETNYAELVDTMPDAELAEQFMNEQIALNQLSDGEFTRNEIVTEIENRYKSTWARFWRWAKSW